MASLVNGWISLQEPHFAAQRNADALLAAGVGHETFGLCPQQALASFEAAAALGQPVAAYNAAVMRLERNGASDQAAARKLLQLAAKAGDQPASALLQAIASAPRGVRR